MFPPSDVLSIRDLEILLFHHQGYKRSKSNCYSNCTLLKIDGVRTKVSGGPVTSLDLGNGWTWKMQEVLDLLELREMQLYKWCLAATRYNRAFPMKKYSEISVCRAGL